MNWVLFWKLPPFLQGEQWEKWEKEWSIMLRHQLSSNRMGEMEKKTEWEKWREKKTYWENKKLNRRNDKELW